MSDEDARQDGARPSTRPSSDDLREYLPARDTREVKAAAAGDAQPVTKPARAKPAPASARRISPAVAAGAVLAVVGPLLAGAVVMEKKTDAKIAAALAKARAEASAPSTGAAPAPAPGAARSEVGAPAASTAPAASGAAAPQPPRAQKPRQAPHDPLDPYEDAVLPPASASAPAEPGPTAAPQAPAPQPPAAPNGAAYHPNPD
jgi:hypothetical protein